jgi:hypothetical protein
MSWMNAPRTDHMPIKEYVKAPRRCSGPQKAPPCEAVTPFPNVQRRHLRRPTACLARSRVARGRQEAFRQQHPIALETPTGIRQAVPTASDVYIRKLHEDLRDEGVVEVASGGPTAKWRRLNTDFYATVAARSGRCSCALRLQASAENRWRRRRHGALQPVAVSVQRACSSQCRRTASSNSSTSTGFAT